MSLFQVAHRLRDFIQFVAAVDDGRELAGGHEVRGQRELSTSPATSTPARTIFGLRRPLIRPRKYGVPRMRCQSTGLTDAARTRINTSSAANAGFAISSSLRTSGGP